MASIITLTARTTAATALPRCCPVHRDWVSLARHLVADFSDVPVRAILDELHQARRAGEFFVLDPANALDCAEVIVRYRVLTATARMPSSPLRAATAFTAARVA